MQDNILKIQEQLRSGELSAINPHACAAAKALLAGEYSFYISQLSDIVVRKPQNWLRLRENVKSDKQADREYERTSDGINELGLEMKVKQIDKMQSALSSLIRMAEMDAKNI